MSAFYKRALFDKEQFDSVETLVTSLAASGWLGPMQLLPPHESELLNLISRDFGLGRGTAPLGNLQDFLHHLRPVDKKAYEGEGMQSVAGISAAVKQQAVQAEQLFKTVQAIGGNWETRLGSWYKSKLLILGKYKDFDYELALSSDLFQQLRSHFQRQRPEFGINNFADAMAFCYLHHRANLASQDDKAALPRFFASTQTIKTLGLVKDKYPVYKRADKNYPVLRDADYYIFRATFNPPSHLAHIAVDVPSLAELAGITTELKALLTQEDDVIQKVLSDLTVGGKKIKQLIEELQRFWFLDRVWVPFASTADLEQAAVHYLRTALCQAQDDTFKQEVQSAVKEAVQQLKDDVAEYDWMSRLCVDLEKHLGKLRAAVQDDNLDNMSALRTFGLLRFGIPERFHTNVQKTVVDLLNSDEQMQQGAVAAFVGTCRDASLSRTETPALAVALSVLWVCRLDRQLDEVVAKRARLARVPEELWVQVFNSAALFRLRQGTERGQRLLSDLERKYQRYTRPADRARLAVGIAYLHFHLWKCKGGEASWRTRVNGSSLLPHDGLVTSAISYAKQAYNSAQSDVALQVYALNQQLYYIVEGGNLERFKEASGLADELLIHISNADVWSFRYDDTLARYFHRLSVLSKTRAEAAELLDLAAMHIVNAYKFSYGDPEVAQYKSILINLRTVAHREL